MGWQVSCKTSLTLLLTDSVLLIGSVSWSRFWIGVSSHIAHGRSQSQETKNIGRSGGQLAESAETASARTQTGEWKAQWVGAGQGKQAHQQASCSLCSQQQCLSDKKFTWTGKSFYEAIRSKSRQSNSPTNLSNKFKIIKINSSHLTFTTWS